VASTFGSAFRSPGAGVAPEAVQWLEGSESSVAVVHEPTTGKVLKNAVVFTDFQWVTLHLAEKSANRLLANWRAMLEESRFCVQVAYF
jgi:hypothetical protein